MILDVKLVTPKKKPVKATTAPKAPATKTANKETESK
jgi:hypothetical protein